MTQIITNTPTLLINAPLTSNTAQTVNIALISQNVVVTKNTTTNNFDVIIQPTIFPNKNSSYSVPQQNVGYTVNSNTVSFNVISVANSSNTISFNTNERNPQIANSKIRVGVNMQFGDNEWIPTFRDRVREARGFTEWDSNGTQTAYNVATLDSNGWPTNNFVVLVQEGGFTPFTGNYYCGFTGSGHESVNATYIANTYISNLTTIGNTTTFNLSMNSNFSAAGFGIGNVNPSVGVQNVFAYLPDYWGNTYTSQIQFTANCLAYYSQFHHLRFMQNSNVLQNKILPYTNSIRATPNNCRATASYALRAGIGNPPQAEYWPIEWMADLCAQANVGGWFNMPIGDDGTYIANVANVLATTMGNLPVYIEIGNELWAGYKQQNGFLENCAMWFMNAHPGIIDDVGYYSSAVSNNNTTCSITGITSNPSNNAQTIITFTANGGPSFVNNFTVYLNNVGGMTQLSNTLWVAANVNGAGPSYNLTISANVTTYNAFTSGGTVGDWNNQYWQYHGYQLVLAANAMSAAFGTRYANTAKVVFATQAAQPITFWNKTIPFVQWKWGGNVNNWIQVFSVAGYSSRINKGVDASPSIISGEIANNSANVSLGQLSLSNYIESTKRFCIDYGLEFVTYEGGYGYDYGSVDYNLPNAHFALMLTQQQQIQQNLIATLFASGVDVYGHMGDGVQVATISGNGYSNVVIVAYNFSNDYPSLMTTGSPRYNGALQTFTSYDPSIILGSSISQLGYTPRNYITKSGDWFWGNNFNENYNVFPEFNTYGGYGSNPRFGVYGVVYNFYCSSNLTLNLSPYFTSNSACSLPIYLDGQHIFTANIGAVVNTQINCGSVTINTGWHSLEFAGHGNTSLSYIIQFN